MVPHQPSDTGFSSLWPWPVGRITLWLAAVYDRHKFGGEGARVYRAALLAQRLADQATRNNRTLPRRMIRSIRMIRYAIRLSSTAS